MSLIDDIKRDREAGAEGPWHLHDCKDWDGRATYHYQEVWTEDCDVIAAEVYRAHNDGGRANMSRIARVPDMEAALLAAEELAEAAQAVHNAFEPFVPLEILHEVEDDAGNVSLPAETVRGVLEALTAFQKAVK